MQQVHGTTPGSDILHAWYTQVAQAPIPHVKQQLLAREGELLPGFAAQYTRLKALPRRMRRSLQRQWKRSLAGVALLLALGQAPALAATINVGGTCTLTRAINSANTNTAVGGCTAGSGADTIVLPANSSHTDHRQQPIRWAQRSAHNYQHDHDFG
jgi:hypothetical protein